MVLKNKFSGLTNDSQMAINNFNQTMKEVAKENIGYRKSVTDEKSKIKQSPWKHGKQSSRGK